jgi:isoquinoline 1-oxidoreductase beta subunit
MEPQNCTAHVTPDKVEIWVPTQSGEAALAVAAAAAEVAPEKVVVHKMMLGGGFGRRGAVQDYVHQAVLVAKAVGQPVKLLWTREEDIRHDFYRPVAMAKFSAGLDSSGMPVAWRVRVTGPSILANLFPQRLTGGVDQSFANGFTEEMAYQVPNYEVSYAMRTTHVPVGFWRSVNHSQNGFFRECFIDEMAHAAGQDPYQYRASC